MKIQHLLLPTLLVFSIANVNANFNLEATPLGSTELPIEGGDLTFNLKIENQFTENKSVDYFNYLIFPDGKHYNIDSPLTLSLSTGEEFESKGHTFSIPSWFPGGNYAYRFSIQDKTTGKLHVEEFPFSKETKGIRLFGHGEVQTCAQDEMGIECWGDRSKNADKGQYNIPRLSEVSEVSIGYQFSCALEKDSNKPNCWGQNDKRTSEPYLVNPRNMVSGYAHSCAIVDSAEKVACWGIFTEGEGTVPVSSLNNPIQITTGNYSSCALNQPISANNFVKCWGKTTYSYVPKHINPSFIATGGYASCMIDQGDIICWGKSGSFPESAPKLSNPVYIAVQNSIACALDDNGLTCWDKTADNIIDVEEISQLSNPSQIVISGGYKCAVDDEGVKCWGKYAQKDNVPSRFIVPKS